jgi:hypothetical protein
VNPFGSPLRRRCTRSLQDRCGRSPGRKHATPAMLTRPPPTPRTVTTGRAPCFYIRPHLLHPHRDRLAVAFQGRADRDLGRPAVPAQQLGGGLDRAADVEQAAGQRVLTRPGVHRWS